MTEQDINQVEYNLSSVKIQWIGELIKRADVSFIQGYVTKAFEYWNLVYGHICSRLTVPENNFCKIIEERFRFGTKHDKKYDYYKKYSYFLQRMLKKYGFDMKEKEDQGWLV